MSAHRPDDVRVPGPAIEREIHWRLLTGPHAAVIRQIGLADSSHTLIASAVEWLQTRYDRPIKKLRRQQARMRFVAGAADIAEDGHAVGYSSPSQFNREYRPRPGVPPGRDAERLQGEVLAAPA